MKRRRIKAFALIEVSIALLILGIITSIMMSQFATIRRIKAEITTQQNIEYVLKSLGAYYMYTGGALPSPTRIDSQTGWKIIGNTDFGLVPYKSLGIMSKYAKDGYGNWLLYKCNPDFGKPVDDLYLNRNMGIAEFSPYVPNDKVAIIIKYSSSSRNNEENYVWYSENNFIQMYTSGKIQSERLQLTKM